MAKDDSGNTLPTLGADAFRKLYPDEYYRRFIKNGVRPDGRTFGKARPTTIGLDAVSTADSSALVKIGSTTVLAGVKLEVALAGQKAVNGEINVNVESTPLCVSVATRSGRRGAAELAQQCTEQVDILLRQSGALDLSKLVISSGRAFWRASMDIYILDMDGSVLDACLLSAIATLASIRSLPSIEVDKSGAVLKNGDAMEVESTPAQLMRSGNLPTCLTCGFYEDTLTVDLTAEEEALVECTLSVCINASGQLIGLYKPGGQVETSSSQMFDCIELAKLRHKEVIELLHQALAAE